MIVKSGDGSSVELREVFLLQPDITYLNHGSFGACPRPVFEAYQAWQLELEHEPVSFLQRRYKQRLNEARAALGAYVGAEAYDLLFMPNAMTGLNTVARSLRLEPDDEVLATSLEYGHMNSTWEFVCAKQGARYVRQSLPLPMTSVEETVEAMWAGVTERTRVIFMSHVTSGTALILPVAEMVRRARENSIITVVDGAQSMAQVDINLREMGVDFYAGNCHKWLMAPKGSAFLYARPEVQEMVEPLVVVSPARDAEHPLDRYLWAGTKDISAYLSVPAALEFAEKYNWRAVRDECHALASQARQRICELTGLGPLSPDEPTWFSQMVSIPMPKSDGTLSRRLWEEYRIEIPMSGWDGHPALRLSVQGYNSQEDIDRLVDALAVLLRG